MPPTSESGRTAFARRVLLALTAVLLAWALVVALTGGADLRPYGIPFRSTEPDRPIYGVLLLMAAYTAFFRAQAWRDVERSGAATRAAVSALARHARAAAAVLALLTTTVGTVYGIPVAGGSDSYGYISQADLWLAGDLITEQPIAAEVPWPEADWTFAPLGYRPALQPGAIVPVYSAGLPVLMAAAKALAGLCGLFLVVPLLGGLTIWLTYALGARLWSPLVGLASAALMATSPTFLFMLMNPMSDVPVTAFFLAALVTALSSVRGRAFWTGVLVSTAIFVRPNLVPLGAIFLALLVVRAPQAERWRALLAFGVGGLPLVLVVAAVNTHLYGAPWNAGYGALDQFYAWRFWLPNLRQYGGWLMDTETPLVLLCGVPLLLLHRLDSARRLAMLFVAVSAAGVWLAYLFYTPYDAWWYLRFLLPAFPPMLVLTAIGLALLVRRFADRQRALAIALVIATALLVLRISNNREQGILSLWQGGIVYTSAAHHVREFLPENAAIFTVQHSGSLRYHAGRLTLRWDQLPADWWPRALDILVERGYRPYLLVSSFEEAQLRERFGFSAAIDGPGTVVAVMEHPEQIRIYDPLRQTTAAPASIAQVVACPCALSADR